MPASKRPRYQTNITHYAKMPMDQMLEQLYYIEPRWCRKLNAKFPCSPFVTCTICVVQVATANISYVANPHRGATRSAGGMRPAWTRRLPFW